MMIYLFRGLFGGLFSTGMDTLAEKLTAQGHSTQVLRWLDRPAIEKQILSGNVSLPSGGVAMIGHSLGGNSANYMANNLAEAGFDVNYVATIDATGPRGTPAGVLADNFRSSDPRDKPVAGANEFNFPDLNHIEIDKDERVHNLILERCGNVELSMAEPISAENEGDTDVPDNDTRASGVTQLGGANEGNSDLSQAVAGLVALLEKNGASGDQSVSQPTISDPNSAAVLPAKDLTPVNGWLGSAIGNMLNGKKTGLGIFGLLSVYVLPVMFPQLAPIQELLKSLGATSDQLVGTNVDTGKELLTPIFAALGGWGILGKIEKWVNKSNG